MSVDIVAKLAQAEPAITDFTETLQSSTTGTTLAIDLANGTIVDYSPSDGVYQINLPAATSGKSFLLKITCSTTADTITWKLVDGTTAFSKWNGGSAPTVSTTAGKIDMYSFVCINSVWYGSQVGKGY